VIPADMQLIGARPGNLIKKRAPPERISGRRSRTDFQDG